MYNQFVYQPILNTLTWLYGVMGNNLGFAIIALTLIIRTILIPFTLPQMKSAKKMAALKPELDALKKKHGSDTKLLQQKTLELYQKNQINPAAGCLPFIAQFIVLIALYQVFMNTLGGNGMGEINTVFFGLDLKAKDPTYILPVLAGILQFIMSVSLLPAIENEPSKREGTKEQKEDIAEMAQSMQQQMVFMMPIMTVIFSLQFPSGLALYWVLTTAFSLVQQLIVSGPGGLVLYWAKIRKMFIK
jgi:YidC/Oxa1 family membrane protein insertase